MTPEEILGKMSGACVKKCIRVLEEEDHESRLKEMDTMEEHEKELLGLFLRAILSKEKQEAVI